MKDVPDWEKNERSDTRLSCVGFCSTRILVEVREVPGAANVLELIRSLSQRFDRELHVAN
jgi:hypothetical protein